MYTYYEYAFVGSMHYAHWHDIPKWNFEEENRDIFSN